MEHPAVYMNHSRNVTILVSVGRRFLRHIPMDGLLRVEKSPIFNFSRDWIPLEKDGEPYPVARAAKIYLDGVTGDHASSEAKRLLTRIAEGAEDAPESETGDNEMSEKKTRTKRTRKAKATAEEILDTEEETTPKTTKTKARKGFKKKAKAAEEAEAPKATKAKAKRSQRAKVEDAPKTSRRARFTEDQVITLLVDENPKRKGTMAWDKWEAYEDGMTVGEYLEKGVGKRSTLIHDVEKGYIEIN